jgi:sigma-B regulation protein RsbU (phosphoserine phosphatase)
MPADVNTERLLELHVPAVAERLALVRAVVKRASETAGCSDGLCEQIVLAVNEACMNVIQHAYRGDVSGEIILEILNNDGELRFRIEDRAAPVDLESVKPRDLEDIRPGGLGVHFIREIMDDCRMGHLEGGRGNFLEMTKKID